MRWMLVGLLVACAACAKKEPIREAEAMADAICKCKTFECALEARKVGTARLVKWKDARGSEAEFREVQAALTRSEVCQQKLQAAASPAGAGAAAGSGPGSGPGSGAGSGPGAPTPAPTPAPGESK